MKTKLSSLVAAFLCLVMLLGVFASCNAVENDSENDSESKIESEFESNVSSQETVSNNTESEKTEKQTETESETDKKEETEMGTEIDTSPKLEGEYAELIENADRISNTVSAYFTDGNRSGYRISNMNMVYDYSLSNEGDILGTIRDLKGNVYVENTMDVFVTMDTGKTYYSSASTTPARANSFRYGYYYYDVRLLDHDFYNNVTVEDEKQIPLKSATRWKEMTPPKVKGGILTSKLEGIVDPHIWWTDSSTFFSSEDYNAISVTLKTQESSKIDVFIIAGEQKGFNESQKKVININPDGQFHTYVIPLDTGDFADYTGTVRGIRLDFNGYVGEIIEISELKILKQNYDGAPQLYLDRTLHTYSNKLNQVAHVVAGVDTTGIKEIGFKTEIDADRVEKLVVKDENGIHNTLEGVDWTSAEYAGFDIKNVGVFGYILLADERSGKLEVTLENGKYVIIQTSVPKNNTILAPVKNTSNDFYMGQRIYTDKNHDFEAFLYEAEIERNPLGADNFAVDAEASSKSSVFSGYDAIRGAYVFTLPPNISFQDSYDNRFNEHNNVVFTVTGDKYDRDIYVNAYAYTTDIECAAILDSNEMMLPVPVEVCKNFLHEHEEPRFDCGDVRYSEAIFPMVVNSGDSQTLKVIQLYQNWGKNPLKQISSIQFFSPYYHLSTGTTETNCISNQYVMGKDLNTLPDHRAMSAPMWKGQPQHTSGGYHHFLQYTDKDGNYSASESKVNIIDSSGPVYAEIDMDYLSDDGRIKVTYTHIEMPQTDENRAYYRMRYEVLEDISFKNFVEDFSFYKASAYQGTYKYIGYLDENNESVVKEVNKTDKPVVYVLGDQCPYFDAFLMETGTSTDDYVNLSCLIYDWEFIIGGERSEADLAIVDYKFGSSLSLNLNEVTLKKGDTFAIDMILMPWGSQETVYDGSNGKAPDQNVRNARENTLLNPIKATALSGCKVIDDDFIPTVISTDGKSATFTISGGADNVESGNYNVAIRVGGFDKLTVPKIYERINGGWKQHTVNSATTPDIFGNHHPYDGYQVQYNGDGTFTYSFIVDMSQGGEREFRVSAASDFKGWTEEDRNPEIEIEVDETPVEDMLEVYFDATELNSATANGASKQTLMQDESGTFMRYRGNGSSTEAYISMIPVTTEPTGQYVVVRYRIPESTPMNPSDWFIEIFSSTTSTQPGLGNFAWRPGVIADGRWHLSIYDMTSVATSKEFLPDENGDYFAKFVRLDMYNSSAKAAWGEDAYIDIAYVGISGSLDAIYAINSDIVDENGRELPDPNAIPDPLPLYFDGEKISKAVFNGAGNKEVLEENGESFARIYGNGKAVETRIILSNTLGVTTGQYVVIKYRIPANSLESYDKKTFDIFTSTVNEGPAGNDFVFFEGIEPDGEWHIVVADIPKFGKNKAFEAKDGEYVAKYVAFDCFNQVTSTESYIDIAYIGMTDDISDVVPLASSLGKYRIFESNLPEDRNLITVDNNQE